MSFCDSCGLRIAEMCERLREQTVPSHPTLSMLGMGRVGHSYELTALERDYAGNYSIESDERVTLCPSCVQFMDDLVHG